MINLELSDRDAEIVSEAHRQAEIYSKYATKFDKTQDHTISPDVLFAVPEEESFPNVRKLAMEAQGEADVSCFEVLSALILVEETWGAKPYYPRGEDADMMDGSIAQKLVKAASTPEQAVEWVDNSLWIAWGMTEPNAAGSDPSTLEAKAEWDEKSGEWIINGEKTFISNPNMSDSVVLMAKAFGKGLEGTIVPFMVAKDNPGMTIGPQMKKLGLHQWDTAGLSLVDCRVPDKDRLQGDLRTALTQFNLTRGYLGAQALGAARAALDAVRETIQAEGIEIDYAAPLSERPAIVDRFIKLEEEYESAWLSVMNAMWCKHHSPGQAEAQYASLAKFVGAGVGRKILRLCIDMLGQDASSKSYRLEQAMRDSRVLDIYEGPGIVLKLFYARWMLGLPKKLLN